MRQWKVYDVLSNNSSSISWEKMRERERERDRQNYVLYESGRKVSQVVAQVRVNDFQNEMLNLGHGFYYAQSNIQCLTEIRTSKYQTKTKEYKSGS